jgi:nucleotide-binding universal stress UspA family protein
VYRKLLIANDGSEGAQAALTAAIYLAKRFRARLHMLSVEELPRFPTTVRSWKRSGRPVVFLSE